METLSKDRPSLDLEISRSQNCESAVKVSALLGYCAASIGTSLLTFQHRHVVPKRQLHITN
jgi:hypothetical protein